MTWLVIVAVTLLPVYTRASGLPQISHVLFAVLVGFIVLELDRRHTRMVALAPIAIGFGLVAWILSVQAVWLLLDSNTSWIVAAQWGFNVALFAALANALVALPQVRIGLAKGIAIALSLSLGFTLLAFGSVDGLNRVTGTANNPNQLAYILVCLWSAKIVLRNFALARSDIYLGVAVGIQLFLSASLSGLVAGVIVAFGVVTHLSKGRGRLMRLTRLLTGSAAVVAVAFSALNLADQVTFLSERWSRKAPMLIEERRLVVSGRGELASVFGAGEGDFGRFGLSGEIHNSFVSMQFAFGLVGLVLFVALLAIIAWGGGWPHKFVFIGVMSYSIAHIGHRTPAFWIFLACYWYGTRNVVATGPTAAKRPFNQRVPLVPIR